MLLFLAKFLGLVISLTEQKEEPPVPVPAVVDDDEAEAEAEAEEEEEAKKEAVVEAEEEAKKLELLYVSNLISNFFDSNIFEQYWKSCYDIWVKNYKPIRLVHDSEDNRWCTEADCHPDYRSNVYDGDDSDDEDIVKKGYFTDQYGRERRVVEPPDFPLRTEPPLYSEMLVAIFYVILQVKFGSDNYKYKGRSKKRTKWLISQARRIVRERIHIPHFKKCSFVFEMNEEYKEYFLNLAPYFKKDCQIYRRLETYMKGHPL